MTLVQLDDGSPLARMESLIARHAPRLMRQGGGALSREDHGDHNPVSKAEALQYLALAQAGEKGRDIAAKFGRTQPCILKHLRRLGFASKRNAIARQRVKDVARLTREGVSLTNIAKRLGVSVSRVCVLRRQVRTGA